MSKKVSFTEFCKHYDLSINQGSKVEYQKYCDNLELFNIAISEDITKKAIEKSRN